MDKEKEIKHCSLRFNICENIENGTRNLEIVFINEIKGETVSKHKLSPFECIAVQKYKSLLNCILNEMICGIPEKDLKACEQIIAFRLFFPYDGNE